MAIQRFPPHFSTPRTTSVTFSSFVTCLLSIHAIKQDGKEIMFSKSVYGSTFRDVSFVPLQSATFCVQCELISTSNKPYCLACGSQALVGLSRVLGGSLRNQQTAHLITDAELDSLVRDLLRTVPDPSVIPDYSESRIPSLAQRSQLRVANAAHPASGFKAVSVPEDIEIHAGELDLEPAISAITERAQHL